MNFIPQYWVNFSKQLVHGSSALAFGIMGATFGGIAHAQTPHIQTQGVNIDTTQSTDSIVISNPRDPAQDPTSLLKTQKKEPNSLPKQSPTPPKNSQEIQELLSELSKTPKPSNAESTKTGKVSLIQQGSITARPLKSIDEDSFGLTDPTDNIIGLWNNTPYDHLVDVTNKTLLSITSPTLYAIAQQALITNATAPNLSGNHVVGDYLLARIDMFTRLGHLKTANDLLTQSPLGARPEFLEKRLTLALLRHDIPNACSLSNQILQQKSHPVKDPLFIKQMDILCQGISGNASSALLRTEALMETNDSVPYLFLDTINYLAGGTAPDTSALTQITPFTLLLARITGMEITKPLLERASPDVLRSASEHPNTSPSALIFALEQLARTGAIDATALRAGYNRIPFDKTQLDNPTDALSNLSPPLQRALLVRSSNKKNGWEHAVSLIKRTKTPEDAIMVGKVVAPVFAKLSPSGRYEEHAPLIAHTLLLAGNIKNAQAWYDERDDFSAPIKSQLATLYPALIANNSDITSISMTDSNTAEWVNEMKTYPIHGVRALARGLTVLNALGITVDKQLWHQIDAPFFSDLETTTQLPSSGLLLLEKFANTGVYKPDYMTTPTRQQGMTALYAINLIGRANAHALSDEQVVRIVGALHATYGDFVARRYATESLVKIYGDIMDY